MKQLNQKGSNILAGLIASVSGVLFALLMADVSRYVIAKSAVQQAAEEVTRCLTPTDAQCVKLSSLPEEQQYDWYGIHRGEETVRTTNRFNYTGMVRKQQWELSIPGYQIHKVPLPKITTNQLSIPVVKFSPELNRYERRFAKIQSTYDMVTTRNIRRYSPLYEPNFPEFHPSYEQQHRYQAPTNWKPISFNEPANISSGYRFPTFHEQPAVSFPLTRVSSGDSHMFESGEFEIPEIESGPDISCIDSNNANCDISYAAGGAASDMWKYAHVAIKAFAQVKKVGNGTLQVRWAGSPWNGPGTPDGYGLSLVRYSKNSYQRYKTQLQAWLSNPSGPRPTLNAEDEQVECLGGTAWADISQNSWANHHLVLRGSIERTLDGQIDYGTGRNSACPGGDNIHWDLKVERGGAYRIRGWVKTKHADGADILVTYRHFTDAYEGSFVPIQTVEQGAGVCSGELPLQRDISELNCSALAKKMCSLDPNVTVRACSLQLHRQPDCVTGIAAANDNFLFELPRMFCGTTVSAAVCDTSWKPLLEPNCDQVNTGPSERIVCGWGTSGIDKFVSLISNELCSAADATKQEFACGDGRSDITYRVDGNYGPVGACPNVTSTLASYRQLTAVVNASQPPGGFIFPEPSIENFGWGPMIEHDPPRWESSITSTDDEGNEISDPLSVRASTIRWRSIGDIFKRNDPNWVPDHNSFGLTPSELAAVASRPTELHLVLEEEFEIRNVYPFSRRPEFEIPTFIPTPQSLESCSGEIAALQDRLKYYADRQIVGIADNTIWFNGNATPIDAVITSRASTCGSSYPHTTIPPCSVEESHTTESLCANNSYLGRFTAAVTPSVCRDGSFQECRSEFVSSSNDERHYDQDIDINLAKVAGLRELQRAFPLTTIGCAGPTCSNISVDLSSDDAAKILVSYNLPLAFPLREILGVNSLNISTEKEDVRELSLVGPRILEQP